MSRDREFEDWRRSRAEPAVAPDFTDRVMAALRPEPRRGGILRFRTVRVAAALLFVAGFCLRVFGVLSHLVSG